VVMEVELVAGGDGDHDSPADRVVDRATQRGAEGVGAEAHAGDVGAVVGGVNPDTADLRDKDPNLAPVGNDFTVHASYADYGPHLDLVAPTQVPTIQFGGGTDLKWSGTSAATPHVAGAATLVAARGKQLGLDLSAGEIIQILRMTADDLKDPARGYVPGWDLLSGWGRVNAFRAVSQVKKGKIPPVPDINSPEWYAPESGDLRVSGSVSSRSPSRWKLLIGKGQQPRRWRRINAFDVPGNPSPVVAHLATREMKPGGYTLLLRARDKHGNVGEDRDFFYVLGRKQQRLHRRFPKFLGTSGEASPALADLNGDGAKDIVLATADGLLRVYDGRSGRMLRGWPRTMRPARGSKEAARHIGPVRSGFTGTPAVGNIAGSPAPEVVETGMDGRLYAWTARGRAVRGFPYRIRLHRPAEKGQLDSAIYSSPALADLTGNRKLEIVFGAADQRVYAVRGNGKDVPGWPVLARDGGSIAKILSSPAIGDLDGDHSPDVVIGTGEAYGSTPSTTGRVYAFSSRGKPLPGWPVEPPALAANSIPLAGQGVPDSPSLADVDGDGSDEVAVAAFTGEPELYDGDGTRMGGAGGQSHFQVLGRGASSPASAPAVIALGANGAFGKQSRSGALGFFGGAVDFRLAQAQLSPATKTPFEHLLGGWDAASGSWLPSFPIPTEGWEILTSPAIADVDGDGRAEVINGTSGNALHAFSADGSEPAGWPKNAGGWLLASPAVGDVDGDHRLEVVDVTRDGYLFVWDTPTRNRARALEWPAFRHDLHNTGNYGN